jgi:sirohydrochlorin cobaltochelatase
MSGTRSHFPKAQAISTSSSLLIVAHGERGGRGDDALVYALAENLRESGCYDVVKSCFIRGEPAISTIGETLPQGDIRVYPLFMSNGYYVEQAIPKALHIGKDGRDPAGRAVRIMQPLGIQPGLADIIAGLAEHTARGAGRKPEKTSLLLVAHGSSKDAASRLAAEAVADKLAGSSQFGTVYTAYLEEAPMLDDQLANLPGPLVVAGLFVGEGMHGDVDLPEAVANCARDDIALCPPLPGWPALKQFIIDDLQNQLGLEMVGGPI